MSKINLDQASTTRVDETVLQTYITGVNKFINHPDSDVELREIRSAIKNRILDLIKVKDKEIIFTSGGTEANNLAILGIANKFQEKKHFITSAYEHASVLNTFRYLEQQGHEVTYILPNKEGQITSESLTKEIKNNTVLISIMKVNNEIGAINDITSLAKASKAIKPDLVFMSDMVQGLEYTSEEELNLVDLFTLSAHKLHGLKGSGLLAKNKNLTLSSVLKGGHNENGYRPGTQDLARELAFAKAIELFVSKTHNNLLPYLKEEISKLENIEINLDSNSHILSIAIKGDMLAESLKTKLAQSGIIVSTKSACANQSSSRSPVLLALGLPPEVIDRTIRISISDETTKEDIEALISALKMF